MKKYLLLLGVFTFSSPVFAQVDEMSIIAANRAERWQLPVAGQQSAEKNTDVTGSRLIKRAAGHYLAGAFPYEDSAYNVYSPLRGFHEKLGWMFDTSTSYIQDPGAHTSTRFGSRSVHKFNTAGDITKLDVYSFDGTTSKWALVASIDFSYLNGKLSETVQSTVVNGVLELTAKTEFYDNTIAKTYTTVRQEWYAGKWEYKEREVTYNVTNKPDSIIFETRNGVSWESKKRTYYTYSGGNAVLIESAIKTGGVWAPDYRESNSYNSGKLSSTVLEDYNTSASSWEIASKEEYTYDNNGNLTETIGYDYVSGGYANDYKQTSTYNKYNQVLTSVSQQWNGSFWAYVEGEDLQQRFYYEEYTTGITDVKNENEQLKIFPVPADKQISVELPQQSATSFTVSLMDMQGRVIRTIHDAERTLTIDVSQIPAGNYIIKAENGLGRFVSQVVITK